MAFNSFKSKNVCTEYFRKNLENLWKITFIINTRLDSRHNFKLKFDGYSNNIKNMAIIFKTMENGTLAKSIICYWLWLYLFQIWWNFDEIWQLDRSRWVDYEVFWHFFKISTLKRDIDGLEIGQKSGFPFHNFWTTGPFSDQIFNFWCSNNSRMSIYSKFINWSVSNVKTVSNSNQAQVRLVKNCHFFCRSKSDSNFRRQSLFDLWQNCVF